MKRRTRRLKLLQRMRSALMERSEKDQVEPVMYLDG